VGWIVGCLAGVCLLLSVAGIVVFALNGQNLGLFASATIPPSPTTTASPIPTSTDTPIPLPTETLEPISNNMDMWEDDFSKSADAWGTGTDSDSSIEYDSEALRMIVFTKNYFVWSTPDNVDYENIHMEVTVTNNGTDSSTAFGIMCAQQADDDSFYYLAITPGREYVIARATSGEEDIFLTNNDKWGSSLSIKRDAASYRVGVDCGNGKLTLYVDGHQIASVSDSTYINGGVGLFTWSGENANSADISFDDFVMAPLE
jgi:hypothetical protein